MLVPHTLLRRVAQNAAVTMKHRIETYVYHERSCESPVTVARKSSDIVFPNSTACEPIEPENMAKQIGRLCAQCPGSERWVVRPLTTCKHPV